MSKKQRKTNYQKEWRLKNPEMVKGHWLRKYWTNVSWKEALNNFNELVAKQNNLCAICNVPESGIEAKTRKIRDLSVDHDHSTNAVRGLLCSRCNRAIGYLKDDSSLCFRAGEYLKKHELP